MLSIMLIRRNLRLMLSCVIMLLVWGWVVRIFSCVLVKVC